MQQLLGEGITRKARSIDINCKKWFLYISVQGAVDYDMSAMISEIKKISNSWVREGIGIVESFLLQCFVNDVPP